MGYSSSISWRIRSTLGGQDGIALLMVLVVITILTTLVVSFTETTQKHLQVTQYSKNRLQAYWAAQSGLQAATAMLRMSGQLGAATQLGGGFDGATSYWHYESDQYQQFVPLLLANVFCESSMLEPALLLTETNSTGADIGLSRTPAAAPILDENRKVSLAKLIVGLGTTKETTDPEAFKRLTHLLQYLLKEADFPTEEDQGTEISPGIEEETRINIGQARDLAGFLVDWMDTENNTSGEDNPDTAEQSCPADGLPYEAKNGLLDSVDEIALVCGFRQLTRTTIERLTRHLTAYNLETNINTATLPVLHAFCAAEANEENETESVGILELLHYNADEESIEIIKGDNDYDTLLGNVADSKLIKYLKDNTAFASSHFRVGIYGLVYNTETGTVLARCRLQMDLARRASDSQFDVLYYRED